MQVHRQHFSEPLAKAAPRTPVLVGGDAPRNRFEARQGEGKETQRDMMRKKQRRQQEGEGGKGYQYSKSDSEATAAENANDPFDAALETRSSVRRAPTRTGDRGEQGLSERGACSRGLELGAGTMAHGLHGPGCACGGAAAKVRRSNSSTQRSRPNSALPSCSEASIQTTVHHTWFKLPRTPFF